jgi:hypothetical protein
MGTGKAVAASVRRQAAWSGRHPSNKVDDWAHAVLYFS